MSTIKMIWSRMTEKKHSWYAIIGVITALVAIVLNATIWHSNKALLCAVTSSLGIAFFLWLFIDVTEHPEHHLVLPSDPGISPFRGLFILGIFLINFAVMVILINIIGGFSFIFGWVLWEVIMNIIDDDNPEFWFLPGSVMYGMTCIIPIIILYI